MNMKDTKPKILVVDDDTTFLLMLKSFLEKKGFIPHTESTAEKGLQAIEENTFDLILSDYRMPGIDGIEMLKILKEKGITTPLILITSYGDIKLAVNAMKLGASDYLTKPVNPEELLALVTSVIETPQEKSVPQVSALAKKSNTNSDNTPQSHASKADFVKGVSPQTKNVNQYIDLVGPTNMSVLIQGESGTGKEYVARQIHNLSKRRDKAFVAIDCGSLSKELAASELFGHIKGSFTGASVDRVGQFEVANGGTLFLDEIGNLSYEIQVKLLRAIQEKVIRRVGGRDDIPIDVRLLAATNENLQRAIGDGEFREDLFHRINEFKIEIAPLRARTEEVKQFANHFLNQANEELEKNVEGFQEETMNLLMEYGWPGNLRELKNVIKRSVLLTQGSLVEKNALPSEISSRYTQQAEDIRSIQDSTDLKQLESALERQKIMEALEKVRFNKTKAAKLLNIDRKTLYNKIKTYGLEV
ncbi:response regulator with CheY-like receiver, AAA-type ATPase, and DNA-binding domains [Owenweeksia hongkongensis DSM 17368]|uniref:Response regulator with CheY-like receiver, AAA-type ATPase, and DNA-binding domains n=1 Tax=Owenweeksia hongkongensis (strain DSM 17368 / CIP 108786 / JCM 12287 / NRRL B-23963 / UST20020801) TaxID=926562 RepID=G8R3F4_OWEHD|nr:response regulator with CheY-like receiver, AAA-type ATPase, and DNA-binding domains [Owenweeksia hongkongensis DSM 17368]